MLSYLLGGHYSTHYTACFPSLFIFFGFPIRRIPQLLDMYLPYNFCHIFYLFILHHWVLGEFFNLISWSNLVFSYILLFISTIEEFPFNISYHAFNLQILHFFFISLFVIVDTTFDFMECNIISVIFVDIDYNHLTFNFICQY